MSETARATFKILRASSRLRFVAIHAEPGRVYLRLAAAKRLTGTVGVRLRLRGTHRVYVVTRRVRIAAGSGRLTLRPAAHVKPVLVEARFAGNTRFRQSRIVRRFSAPPVP